MNNRNQEKLYRKRKQNHQRRKNQKRSIFITCLIFLLMFCCTVVIKWIYSADFNDFSKIQVSEKKQKNSDVNLKFHETENSYDTENNLNSSSKEQRKNELKVHILDVGQGDSIIIELPNEEVMLIDGGEAKEAEKIIQYLKSLGWNKIDYMIGTHPHADHIGGLASIMKAFDIQSIYMPKAISTSKTYEFLLETIIEKKLSVKEAKKGVFILKKENFTVEILSPNKEEYNNLNNYSAIIQITYYNRRFLFMGDAEEEVEAELSSIVSSDVIKIGHHGSITSTSEEFLNKVNPEIAVISVGKENKYMHPNQIILDRLTNIGAKIYRTDESGNIKVITDGISLEVQTEKEKNK